MEQVELLQTGVPLETLPQALPQPPQLLRSCETAFSQPLKFTPSQLANPALHIPMTQLPALHEGVALASVHTERQAPQLLMSAAVGTSQPLAALASQSA